ncbi:metallophosphoesterase [Kribbella sp. NPDC051587]|uniref:metallophosphoesterase n=1 Tax=Kribbella sp. NPDC051587 TaxID=3364119 RepID=UPI0037B6249D
MTTRVLDQVVATTDFHSSLDRAGQLMGHLHAQRPRSLVVDCGDFFEGTGYYSLGRGDVERRLLLSAYDVIAPGNHGWSHHFEPKLRELTVCANAVDTDGRWLFRQFHKARIGNRTVGVTAVISPQAFSAIPLAERASHRVFDPAAALWELRGRNLDVQDWIVLSHSGFTADQLLAAKCPFVSVVFSGHCHSPKYGPLRVGRTLVVKGPELGRGYAAAEPTPAGWTARSLLADSPAPVPRRFAPIADQITNLHSRLTAPMGTILEPWRNRTVEPRELLTAVVAWLHERRSDLPVILNEPALRTVQLGEVLTLADLLAVEPFANELVHTPLPYRNGGVQTVLQQLTDRAGPLLTAPAELPSPVHTALMTGYLAETFQVHCHGPAGLTLGGAVCHVLTGAGPAIPEGGAL